MSEHTPEPWRLGRWIENGKLVESVGCHQVVIDTDIGPYVLLEGNQNFMKDAEENARRVVACVNACAGIPTEKLEQHADDAAPVFALLMETLAQRDALRAALEEGRRAIGDHYAPDDCYATGPMTGNGYRDLVECPSCSFIAMYDAVIGKDEGEPT